SNNVTNGDMPRTCPYHITMNTQTVIIDRAGCRHSGSNDKSPGPLWWASDHCNGLAVEAKSTAPRGALASWRNG
ncbi:hypothetical protein HAX54_038895, partial [Datura stramonium]|nr:hypothetical protein [Datura stramonium]